MATGREIRQLRFDTAVGMKLMREEVYQYFPNAPDQLIRLPPERQALVKPRLTALGCPHCGNTLDEVHQESHDDVIPGYYKIQACRFCGMWRGLEECSISYGNYVLPYVKGFQ